MVLVRAGSYSSFVIDGRGLVVAADTGHAVTIEASVAPQGTVVRNLGPAQRVVLAGLVFDWGQDPATAPWVPQLVEPLRVENCAGLVWMQDLQVTVLDTMYQHFMVHDDLDAAFLVQDADQVLLNNVVLDGLEGGWFDFITSFAELGTPGLLAINSNIHAFNVTARGGYTGELLAQGTAGIVLESSFLSLQSSLTVGGQGGEHWGLGVGGAQGGSGLSVDSGSVCWAVGTTLAGGLGGYDSIGYVGPLGVPFDLEPGGVLHQIAAPPHHFGSDNVVRDGDAVTLTFGGQAGDLVFLLFSFETDVSFVPALATAVGVGLGPIVVPAGCLPASGELVLNMGTPALPPGLDSFPFVLQAAFVSPVHLGFGGPSLLFLVDDAL